MGVRKVAFRVFGRFTWSNNVQRPGQFEFFFDDDVDKGLTPCVEWQPHEAQSASGGTAPLAIAALTPKQIADVSAGAPFTLSLAGPARFRLVVPGAQVLDHFALDAMGGPSRRWLLARDFVQGKTISHSAVVLGQNPKDAALGIGFELQLAIPAPAPQGIINKNAGTAFPFRVRYGNKRDVSATRGLRVDWVAAGAEGQASACKWLDLRTGDFDPSNFRSRILGEFGFCAKDGGKSHLFFPRDADGSSQGAIRKALWTSDASRYARETLGLFADGTNNLASNIAIAANGDHHLLSIWFADQGMGSQTYFRSAFKPDDPAFPITKGDLRVNDGLHPLDPFGVGECLQQADGTEWTLLDLVTDWNLSDTDVVDLVEGDAHPAGWVAVRLSVTNLVETIKGDGELQPVQGEFAKTGGGTPSLAFVTPSQLIGIGLRSTRMPRMGLDILSPLEPSNALPDMVIKSGGKRMFALAADVPVTLNAAPFPATAKTNDTVDAIQWQIIPRKRPYWRKVDFGLRLWDYDADRAIDHDDRSIDATFTLPGVDTAGASARAKFSASLMIDRTVGDPARAGQIAFTIEPGTGRAGGARFDGRIAGLAFGTDTPRLAESSEQSSEIASHWRFRPGCLLETAGRQITFFAGENDFQLSLLLNNVTPLGVDIPWGDRTGRPRPLLLRLDAETKAQSSYVLTLRERVARDDDRRLTAELRHAAATLDSGAQSAPGSSDGEAPPPPNGTAAASPPSPHYVILSEQPFSILRFAASSLANRGDDANTAVAIYDSDTRQWSLRKSSPTYQYTLPPQGIGESMDKPRRLEIHDAPAGKKQMLPFDPAHPAGKDGALWRFGVDYRLTAPADLWIEPSDVERNFLLPEWASYEIFRQRGELGLGVGLAGLRAEFLYGLALSIDPTKERGAAATTRVAEIEALLGHPAKPGELTFDNRHWMRRFARLLDVVARRPERLEFWMREPGAAQPFTPATFGDGVRFALRDRALLRSPFEEEHGDWSGLPPIPRLSDFGLAGGALWPLESRAYCRAFIENPESTGGTVSKLALGPQGGDVDFRAEFLNGKLAIIAEVREGRVQRQRVEIIGRIGAFWHRAKHVVIYDRSASPSAQFTPLGGIGDRSRRPILRKVEEFIELLEPERVYPDTPNASAAAPGFLHAMRFNATRIHVDSAWSEDVGSTGWQIPLWNQLSARQRPSVYPHPDIVFVSHAEGEEDQPLVAQQCLDSDNLYFYTDADTALTGDTDRWPPVLSVDWINLPAPTARQQPKLDDADLSGDKRQPATPRIPRGQRRFTWHLGSATRRTRINAGRASQPIFVSLDTLTFSRSQPADDAAAVQAFDATLVKTSDTLGTTAPALDTIRSGLDRLANAVTAGDDGSIAAAATALTAMLTAVDIKGAVAGLKVSVLDDLAAATSGQGACQKLVNDLAGSLERKKSLIMARLRAWLEDASKDLPALDPDRGKWIDAVVKKMIEALTPALGEVAQNVGRLEDDVARAQGIVAQANGDVVALFEMARRKLAEIHQSFDDGKPWSIARIESYQQRLETARAGLIGDLTSLTSEIRTRLATELGNVSHGIAIAAGQALDQLADKRQGALAAIGTSQSAAALVLAHVRGGYAAKMEATQKGLVTAIKAIEPTKPAIAKTLRAIAAQLASVSQRINGILAAADADLARGAAGLDVILNATFDQVSQAIGAYNADVQALMTEITAVADQLAADPDLQKLVNDAGGVINGLADAVDGLLTQAEGWALDSKHYFTDLETRINAGLAAADKPIEKAFAAITKAKDDIALALKGLKDQMSPDNVTALLSTNIVWPAFDLVLSETDYQQLRDGAKTVEDALRQVLDTVEENLARVDALAVGKLDEWRQAASTACGDLNASVDLIKQRLADEVDGVIKQFPGLEGAIDAVKGAIGDYTAVVAAIENAKKIVGEVEDAIAATRVQAEAYADRVVDAAGKVLSGGIAAAPNNLLRLYAAVASAPSLPNLDFAREQMGYYFDALKSVIDTSPAEAWFGRLGSELKALGLSLPFDHIGESLMPSDLSNFDIGRVFRNIGGIDLSSLFSGYRLPQAATDAIHVTHNFDAKQVRAWVQIDVDVALPGRKSLFAIGPFSLDFVDSRLAATVRLEASKDTERVEQTGHAALTTTVDSVVSGQSMVTLEDLVVSFEQGGGLHVELDSKKIKLNPAFRFIQETFGSLFPDDIGGLKILKQNSIPIGVEHEYSMPPINVMGGTSGISNLAISNHFSLVAYPDFVIANRFALSKAEAPFLFTVFIIGGTGYLTVDAEYRPFTSDLTVVVEAAVGGSAALGFALGPITGSVSISLSVALAYQKRPGRSGGGLRASLELLIAGNVDVAGIASVNLALLLRMQYHESGRIDGVGTVSVSIRICRFYTYRYRSNANYTLRDGGGGGSSAAAYLAATAQPATIATLDAPARSTARSTATARAQRILRARA